MNSESFTLTVSIDGHPPYGFRLSGGEEMPLIISKVRKGSKAEDVGMLEGDILLAVNGVSCEHMTHASVNALTENNNKHMTAYLLRGRNAVMDAKFAFDSLPSNIRRLNDNEINSLKQNIKTETYFAEPVLELTAPPSGKRSVINKNSFGNIDFFSQTDNLINSSTAPDVSNCTKKVTSFQNGGNMLYESEEVDKYGNKSYFKISKHEDTNANTNQLPGSFIDNMFTQLNTKNQPIINYKYSNETQNTLENTSNFMPQNQQYTPKIASTTNLTNNSVRDKLLKEFELSSKETRDDYALKYVKPYTFEFNSTGSTNHDQGKPSLQIKGSGEWHQINIMPNSSVEVQFDSKPSFTQQPLTKPYIEVNKREEQNSYTENSNMYANKGWNNYTGFTKPINNYNSINKSADNFSLIPEKRLSLIPDICITPPDEFSCSNINNYNSNNNVNKIDKDNFSKTKTVSFNNNINCYRNTPEYSYLTNVLPKTNSEDNDNKYEPNFISTNYKTSMSSEFTGHSPVFSNKPFKPSNASGVSFKTDNIQQVPNSKCNYTESFNSSNEHFPQTCRISDKFNEFLSETDTSLPIVNFENSYYPVINNEYKQDNKNLYHPVANNEYKEYNKTNSCYPTAYTEYKQNNNRNLYYHDDNYDFKQLNNVNSYHPISNKESQNDNNTKKIINDSPNDIFKQCEPLFSNPSRNKNVFSEERQPSINDAFNNFNSSSHATEFTSPAPRFISKVEDLIPLSSQFQTTTELKNTKNTEESNNVCQEPSVFSLPPPPPPLPPPSPQELVKISNSSNLKFKEQDTTRDDKSTKMLSSYCPPGHNADPSKYSSLTDHVKIANKLACAVTSPDNENSKGQKMFLARQQSATVWSNDGDELQQAKSLPRSSDVMSGKQIEAAELNKNHVISPSKTTKVSNIKINFNQNVNKDCNSNVASMFADNLEKTTPNQQGQSSNLFLNKEFTSTNNKSDIYTKESNKFDNCVVAYTDI